MYENLVIDYVMRRANPYIAQLPTTFASDRRHLLHTSDREFRCLFGALPSLNLIPQGADAGIQGQPGCAHLQGKFMAYILLSQVNN